jgi:hypothetical protein
LGKEALQAPGLGDWPVLDAFGEDERLLAPFFGKLLVRKVVKAINRVDRRDVFGVVAQRDMTADERAVQHVREDVAAIYPDILFREAQNCRSP